jgi:hypothetical protein
LPLAAFGFSPLTLAGLLSPLVAEQNALGLYKTYAITDGNVNGYRGGEQLQMDVYGLSNVSKLELPDAIIFINIVGVRHEQSQSATDITGVEGFGPSGVPAIELEPWRNTTLLSNLVYITSPPPSPHWPP